MDTEQLRVFVAIAREGGFTRAARALQVPQPTVSARMRALEGAVGGLLFVRGGRRIGLTERGEAFLPYAERALRVLAEGVEVARLAEAGERGRVTVGVMESLAAIPLAPTVARILADHPAVELRVESGHSEQIAGMLRDGTVRLGLITAPFLDADLVALVRLREPLVLVAGASHPLARLGPVALAEAVRAARPFLWVPWNREVVALRERLREEAGGEEAGGEEAEVPIGTLRELLLRGTGAGYLTRALVTADLDAGRLAEVEVTDGPTLTRDSALVAPKRAAEPPAAVRAFADALRREAAAQGLLL